MKTFRHLGAAIGAALLCAAGAAQANQNETSISYANLRYQVIDLTPDDGVAAGFTITFAATNVELFTSTPYGIGTGQQRFSSAQGAPLSASLQRENISLQGSTAGSASGMLSGVISDQDTIDSRGTGAVRSTISFELAPNTALLLTGDLSVTLGQQAGLPPGVGSFGRGSIDMELYQTEQSMTSHATATLGRNTWQHGSGTFDQDLSLVISNRSDVVRRGGTRIELAVDTRYYTAGGVPAVPEPSTYLMLGTGLAIAGVMARRRKQA